VKLLGGLVGQKYRGAGILVSVFILSAWAQVALAVGISPSTVTIPTILNQTEINAKFHLSRPVTTDEGTYSVIVPTTVQAYIHGPAEVTFGVGNNTVDYQFSVAPGNLATGDYSIPIVFSRKVSQQQVVDANGKPVDDAQLAIVDGVQGLVNFSVTGDRLEKYTVNTIAGSDTEINAPFIAYLDVTNSGNVDWRPDQVDLLFTDLDNQQHTFSLQIIGDAIPFAQAGQQTVLKLEFPDPTVQVGTFKLQAKVYKAKAIVADLTSTNAIIINPEGTSQKNGELQDLTTNKANYNQNELVKFTGHFKNTGVVPVAGALAVEVYLKDSLVDIVRSSELTAQPGETVPFTTTTTLTKTGEYKLVGYVEYENKVTAQVTAQLTVIGGWYQYGIIGVVLFAILLWMIYYKYKRSKKDSEKNNKKFKR